MEELLVTPQRRTRALGELQRQTTVTDPNGNQVRSRLVPSSMMSPSPSPDELIIRLRGRRKVPPTYSPENEAKQQRTPSKLVTTPSKRGDLTPSKNTPPRYSTRQSPRKRLPVYDLSSAFSPKKGSPLGKRPRFESKSVHKNAPVEVLVRGLSQPQVVTVLQKLLTAHPELKEEIDLPEPDISAYEEQLSKLKKNIFRSLPSNRLASRTDSPAYNRACIHLIDFKKAIAEHGKILTDSQQWAATVRYCLIAWSYVRATPMWENATHNSVRRHCFRMLASYFTLALRKGDFDTEAFEDIKERLGDCAAEADEIQPCLDLVNSSLEALTKESSEPQKP